MIKINKKKYYIVIIIIVILVMSFLVIINLKKEDEYLNSIDIVIDEETVEGEVQEEVGILNEKIKIHILGQVKYNGIIELEVGSRISDAIEIAGGLTELADVSKINLAYILEDGEKLYIPSINDEEGIEYLLSNNSTNLKVNINTAKIEELQNIPGVGPSIAQAIIDYRNENGRFKSIEDIKKVSGVGESKYKKMEDYIRIK